MTVIRINDHLRKKCLAHAALMRILQRPMPVRPMSDNTTDSDLADEILVSLWEEGFKVVPRDDK